MIPCLIGHGFLGTAIAHQMAREGLPFNWQHHADGYFHGDIIVNASGYTGNPNVDACEREKRECISGNVVWPLECERKAWTRPVIHIGSGCVYSGEGPFTEEDQPNFDGSFYSLSKSLSQESLVPYLRQSYLLRVRMPFSAKHHPKNLLTKLANYSTLVNYRNSLTCLDDLAEIVIWFVRKRPAPGIYNVVNKGSVTTREIADWMGLRKQWFARESDFLASVRAPRSNCTLDTAKLESVYPYLPTVEQRLKECIGQLRQQKAA